MNILNVSMTKRCAEVRLNSDELVELCNALYHAREKMEGRPLYYSIAANFDLVRDLSQYGSIDGFSFETIAELRQKSEQAENK